ncbi:MAG: amylo-alpha-1,6-glucosidase [Bacteroidota bacterium]
MTRLLSPVFLAHFLLALFLAIPAFAQVPRFDMPESGLMLERQTEAGTFGFFSVLGRRAGAFGYEGKPFEVWTYPQQIVSEVQFDVAIDDYPIPIDGLATMERTEVRPEATTFVYTHAAFTIRQTLFAPIDEPAVVMLLDIDTVRPLTLSVSFRPDLALMWPAGLMTGFSGFDAAQGRYFVGEETQRFYGIIGSPGAVDVSQQPYQEEPADLPTRFELRVTPEDARAGLIPIIFTGSTTGRADAEAVYDQLLADVPGAYAETVQHYADLEANTLTLDTPDDRLDEAFAWAKVGIDKGLATNPTILDLESDVLAPDARTEDTGFVAGFRTAGNSERPGFAWFFGRDALWTALATTAYGDFETTKTALDFLQQFQRADGKIPHEISQSATFLTWFEDYPYPWASADATPLYLIVLADLWRATGDDAFLRKHWDSAKAAYAFSEGTDRDGNDLLDNTGVGHGWVEGGLLYPPHEELYMQGLWIEASESLAEIADALGEGDLAEQARANAERTRAASEAKYWLADEGFYAVTTHFPDATNLIPDEGAQAGTALSQGGIATEQDAVVMPENTAMQGVPFWWATLDHDRAQRALDALGSGHVATDWGARILDAQSERYDPLSYHNGSVWPLFTGWVSMGGYSYARPHVGYQGLMASALLTRQDALGYVTELLSGDFNTAFGRSSHLQVWSEAMVATPAVTGMLGLDATADGSTLRFAPQLPHDWDRLALTNAAVGDARFAITMQRYDDATSFVFVHDTGSGSTTLDFAPAFPLDAIVEGLLVNGEFFESDLVTEGDVQRVVASIPLGDRTEITVATDSGTGAYVRHEPADSGARSMGLRILRDRAEDGALNLLLEGVGGETYAFGIRSPRTVIGADGVAVRETEARHYEATISFEGTGPDYVRRAVSLPLGD